jgi:endonuclease YncB( thermonuclease family)
VRRRKFLSTVTAALLSTGVARNRDAGMVQRARAASTVPAIRYASSSSLVDANYDPLTNDTYVAVWAEDTATNVDDDGDGYATNYPDETPIPVVASDGSVVGMGSMLVEDGMNWQRGNEEFLLNVWDTHAGNGTVLWDEGHSQYYTLSKFSTFEAYAENNGYTVTATRSLKQDLQSAAAAVITSPSSSFSNGELNALADFVANGGALFLHDQSDYSNYDETANLNDIPGRLNLAFRFNDDSVNDRIQNDGEEYKPVADMFNDNFPYFADREGLGLDPTKTYTTTVNDVLDGDTVKVDLEGTAESIRILGMDTPEKASNSQYERIQEWEGIEDTTYLENRAAEATTYATDRLADATVDVFFDENEPVRDAFGRVLGYIRYDATGDGTRNTLYNREIVADGYARVYDSGFRKHDEILSAETDARANGRNVWAESDPENSSEIRDRAVDDVFLPVGSSVRSTTGGAPDSAVPVYAETEASQELDGGHAYSGDIPLVGLDQPNRVAVFGSPLIDESYEKSEGYAVDTSTFENFVFLTNVVDTLAGRSGDVLVDGGHGQFNTNYALSAEDVAYYLRYLEGQGIGLQGMNGITSGNLSGARALLITAPRQAYTSSELDALGSFVDNGGAVVLLNSGRPLPAARDNLNTVASALGTDLRVNEDLVTDGTNNVNSDSEVPTTTNFDRSFDLFDAFTSDSGSPPSVDIKTIHEDGNTLNDEYVVFENGGSTSIDMTDWFVEDLAGHRYTFSSFTLDAGATVTLRTGSGTDSSSDIYWGRGSSVWNNDGDTGTLYDDTGATQDEYSYPTGSSSGDLAVKTVHADAAGNDSDNLNDEYVIFENTGSGSLDLTDYQVTDEAGKTYTFPSFTLEAGATVTLYTGSGTDSSTDLYWAYGSPVWNNSGDTVYVEDAGGSQVLKYPY